MEIQRCLYGLLLLETTSTKRVYFGSALSSMNEVPFEFESTVHQSMSKYDIIKSDAS
jgi:hypothetical protein